MRERKKLISSVQVLREADRFPFVKRQGWKKADQLASEDDKLQSQ